MEGKHQSDKAGSALFLSLPTCISWAWGPAVSYWKYVVKFHEAESKRSYSVTINCIKFIKNTKYFIYTIKIGESKQYNSILWSQNHFRLKSYDIGMWRKKKKKQKKSLERKKRKNQKFPLFVGTSIG